MKLYFPHFSAADTNFQYPKTTLNHFSGAMVSVFTTSEIVSESGQTLVFAASPLSTQNRGIRTKPVG